MVSKVIKLKQPLNKILYPKFTLDLDLSHSTYLVALRGLISIDDILYDTLIGDSNSNFSSINTYKIPIISPNLEPRKNPNQFSEKVLQMAKHEAMESNFQRFITNSDPFYIVDIESENSKFSKYDIIDKYTKTKLDNDLIGRLESLVKYYT